MILRYSDAPPIYNGCHHVMSGQYKTSKIESNYEPITPYRDRAAERRNFKEESCEKDCHYELSHDKSALDVYDQVLE